MDITRKDFTGGINRKDGVDKLADSEYPLGINLRVRANNVAPIKKAAKLTGINAALFQGCEGIENYLIVAADGYLYWRDLSQEDSNFAYFRDAAGAPIVMDPSARIHFKAIPASSINRKRVPVTANVANTEVNYTATVNGSPAAILVTDGVSQPAVVFLDGSGRRTKSYAEWTDEDPEYVPIGSIMYYNGNTVYMLSPDGKYLYRSVSGMPLNFVIVLDNNGAKAGDAVESAYRYSYERTTALSPLYGSTDFMASTATQGFRIQIDYTNVFFGEPSHTRVGLASGAIHHYGVTTIGADTVFVDANGIKSFNAIAAVASKAEVDPFSLKVQPLMNGVLQQYPCAISLRDYTYFSVNTIFGQGIMVYDETLRVFVSLDLDPRLTDVIRFTTINTQPQQKLVVCTTTGIYIYEDSDEYAEAGFYYGEISSPTPAQESSAIRLRVRFTEVFENGTVTVLNYVDGKLDKTIQQELLADDVTIPAYPWTTPTPVTDNKLSATLNFQYEGDLCSGSLLGFWIKFAFNAQLNALHLETRESGEVIPSNQQYV